MVICFLKNYCMYMIMRGITVKQYSLTIYNSYSKRNKTPTPCFAYFCILYFIRKKHRTSSVLFKTLCTLNLHYLFTKFCIIYLLESATFKSRIFQNQCNLLSLWWTHGVLCIYSDSIHYCHFFFFWGGDAHIILPLIRGKA